MFLRDEILAQAAQLDRSALRALRRDLKQLERERYSICLEEEEVSYRLTRLDDNEYVELGRHSLAIAEDYGFLLELGCYTQKPGCGLSLPQLYLALKTLTGESGRYFDDWKGSFVFPFALKVRKNGQEFNYLLKNHDLRGSFYFSLRKIVAEDDERLAARTYFPPFEEEFSRSEIRGFCRHWYGFLEGYWSVVRKREHAPFVHKIRNDFIVFGYCKGKTFEKQYQSERAYDAACERYESQVAAEKKARKADENHFD